MLILLINLLIKFTVDKLINIKSIVVRVLL